jgi:uncharacterized membrane protein YfcA
MLLLAKPYLFMFRMNIPGLWSKSLLLLGSGMLTGLLSGLMGGGGGIVMVPVLVLGAYQGANVAHLLHEGALRIVFALVLTSIGIRYLRAPVPLRSLPQTP